MLYHAFTHWVFEYEDWTKVIMSDEEFKDKLLKATYSFIK